MYEKACRGGRERAFGGGYKKAANLAAGLSFVVVFEIVLFKPDVWLMVSGCLTVRRWASASIPLKKG